MCIYIKVLNLRNVQLFTEIIFCSVREKIYVFMKKSVCTNLTKFKGTVDVILGNPPFVAGHVQFTKIYKEPFSEN